MLNNYVLRCVGLSTVSQVLEGVITEEELGQQLILDVKKYEDLCREVLRR